MRCKCGNRDAWRVLVRRGNYSAFNGYRRAYSDYSQISCESEEGGCGALWRTKAKYADVLPESERWGETFLQRRDTGERGHKEPGVAYLPSVPEPPKPRLVCEVCGQPGGPLLGPLTAAFFVRHKRDCVFHRDLPACRTGIAQGEFALEVRS